MSESNSPRPEPSIDDSPAFVQKLRSGKPILFKPRGHSMEPHLSDGTVVMIDPVRRLPRSGDVVLVMHSLTGVTLHRVRKIRDNGVWLQGDAMRHREGPYPLEYVVGIARLTPLTALQRLRLWVLGLMFQ